MPNPGQSVEKTLSRNDTGETGSHQAGLHVPKEIARGGFFPHLDPAAENPRATIACVDDRDRPWAFEFIYYNNGLRGGTRNEYRLTRMTPFFREVGLKAGDVLVFDSHPGGAYRLSTHRKPVMVREAQSRPGVLTLRGGWKVIKMRGA